MINKTLSDVNEPKARENNLILFNLIESEKDRECEIRSFCSFSLEM